MNDAHLEVLPPLQVSRRVSRLLVVLLVCGVAAVCVPAAIWMKGQADEQDRRNNAMMVLIGVENYDDTFHRLPQDARDPDGNLTTSWRLEMMQYVEKRKPDWDAEQPWTAPINSYARSIVQHHYCGETTNARVFLIAKRITSDGTADSHGLNDLPPETLLFLTTPRDSDIHWMEPRDLTLDEALSPAICPPGEYVFVTFADGQIWKLTAECKNDLRRFIEPEPDLPNDERQRVLAPFGRWMNPPKA